MKACIKDWPDAVKSALADSDNWYVEGDSIFAYPMCVVDELEDEERNSGDILRYGKVITDDQIYTINVDVDRRPVTGDVRIRLVEFDGLLFYHKMVNGDVVDCRCVGKTDA